MWLRVFKSGNYPQGNFSPERTEKLVSSYDPSYIEAAAVVGHMDNTIAERIENEFAYGWFSKFEIRKDGYVWGEMPDEDVSKDLARWITEKKLKYVSAEIIEFDKKDSSKAPYLARVAFLGRSIPAVKGAGVGFASRIFKMIGFSKQDPVLDTGENVIRFCNRLDTETLSSFKSLFVTTQTPQLLEENQSIQVNFQQKTVEENKTLECSMTEEEKTEFERLKAENDSLKNKFSESEKKNAEYVQQQLKTDAESFFQKFKDDGRLSPAVFEETVAFDVSFGMDKEARLSYRKLFSKQHENTSPVIGLGTEHVAKTGETFSESESNGQSVVAEVRAYAEEHKLTYSAAVGKLQKERPELFKEGM